MKSLYPGHKVSSIEVVFDFLDAYSINLKKELTKILEDKKVVNVTTERSQKWIISQNCEIADTEILQRCPVVVYKAHALRFWKKNCYVLNLKQSTFFPILLIKVYFQRPDCKQNCL